MNPWELIWNGLGWLVIAVVCIFVIVFVIATIVTVWQKLRRKKPRTTEILSSSKQ